MDTALMELEKAQQQATQAAERLKNIVNTVSEGICMYDDCGTITFWSPSCEQILGFSEKEALGKQLENLIPIDNKYPSSRKLFKKTAADESEPPTLIFDAKNKNGKTTPLELSLTGWEEESGWVHVAVFRDMGEHFTHQVELEKALKKANEANLAKTQFLANMSHELRTPLNAIIGFSELILNHRLKEMKAEEIQEDINIIHASGQHLLALINEVLDISKVEAGKMELNIWPVDIPPLVKTACQLSETLVKEQNNLLVLNFSKDLKVMNLDPKITKQILMNLINNAAKFTKGGTITIVVRQEMRSDRLWAIIEVIDTGIGIKETALDSVFERFSQVDDSHTREHQGTGLGLALVKTFVEFMGGTISVASTYGAGTTFTVEIPDGDHLEATIEPSVTPETLPAL
ncbi:MAG: PAS domain-containing sensor histidine kinase [Emcibacteraceae bacterium]